MLTTKSNMLMHKMTNIAMMNMPFIGMDSAMGIITTTTTTTTTMAL